MIDIIILILAILVAILLFKVFKTGIHLAINAVLGILILFIANSVLGLQIKITLLPILICAFAGIFGAFVVIILGYLKIAFV